MRRLIWCYLLIYFCCESTWAQDLRELIRPLTKPAEVMLPHAVSKLKYEGLFTQIYVYTDILQKNQSNLFQQDLENIARYFDQEICPRMRELLQLPILNRQQKIILLFDENLSYRGYHSRILAERYQRDFILLDIKENLDSNALKYRLPHELQHILRYHYNKTESDWLNEGLSVFAEFLVNEEFPVKYLDAFSNLGGHQLSKSPKNNGEQSFSYFNSFLFVYYLYQHYGGIEMIKQLIRSTKSGWQNIDEVLAQQKSVPPKLKSFYNFEKAFINYQLALVLNPFRDTIESQGFFDLRLDRANLPKDYHSFSARTGILPWNQAITLNPLSSHFYDLDDVCVSIERQPKTSLIAVLIDMNSKDPNRAIQIMQDAKFYCVNAVTHVGQYVVLINSDKEKPQPFILAK